MTSRNKAVFLKQIIIGILLFILPTDIYAIQGSQPLPRVVYALYDKEADLRARQTLLHRTLEMPLNWLGLHLEFIEMRSDLPAWRDDVAGIVLWLPAGTAVPNPDAYVSWLQQGVNQGKKLVILGNAGFDEEWLESIEGAPKVEALLRSIGVSYVSGWMSMTYATEILHKNPKIVEFEREYGRNLEGYFHTQATQGGISHLQVKNRDDTGAYLTSDLVITHPNGGYVAEGYALYAEVDKKTDELLAQRWFINPFAFLTTAFGLQETPRPDVSTLNGKRIYYSHLDGDGWNNLTEIAEYRHEKTIAAKVLLEEIYRPYNQLPFTVAPIVAELDPNCYGRKESAEIAREIFALPNVEPASHTYSHPLFWAYFDDGNIVKELRHLHAYPDRPERSRSIYDRLGGVLSEDRIEQAWGHLLSQYNPEAPPTALDKQMEEHFPTPRSYACEPYELGKEITGSVAYLSQFVPEDKQIELIQWSGDTSPTEPALRETRKAGLFNINGGDSRFDPDYPSYSYVAPIGVRTGAERQIYSSNSNENTYTALWSERFFGFKHLVATVKNTETPRRISPFNIYYHSYSAQKQPSLEALKQNLNYALSRDIAPVFTSDYVKIANGFYHTELIPLGEERWRIRNRGALQTIRFDDATLKAVDFHRSKGVIGQQHYQGSLYVSLHPKAKEVVIALKPYTALIYPAAAETPYLIASRWQITDWQHHATGLRFDAKGFAQGIITLYLPPAWREAEKLEVRFLKENKLLQKNLQNVKGNAALGLRIPSQVSSPVTVEVDVRF